MLLSLFSVGPLLRPQPYGIQENIFPSLYERDPDSRINTPLSFLFPWNPSPPDQSEKCQKRGKVHFSPFSTDFLGSPGFSNCPGGGGEGSRRRTRNAKRGKKLCLSFLLLWRSLSILVGGEGELPLRTTVVVKINYLAKLTPKLLPLYFWLEVAKVVSLQYKPIFLLDALTNSQICQTDLAVFGPSNRRTVFLSFSTPSEIAIKISRKLLHPLSSASSTHLDQKERKFFSPFPLFLCIFLAPPFESR